MSSYIMDDKNLVTFSDMSTKCISYFKFFFFHFLKYQSFVFIECKHSKKYLKQVKQ